MAKANLTAQRLRELLHYDPDMGVFTWRIRPKPIHTGSGVCGYKSHRGYTVFSIDGGKFSAHRLAWLYMTGEWPRHMIDHIDGNKANDAWSNLREASALTNIQNERAARNSNKAGFLGVFETKFGTWQARIRIDGKKRYLGSHKSPEAAYASYLAAKRAHHAGCTI